MSGGLRIKWIAGGIPWPLDSGIHQRHYHILQALSEMGEVDAIMRCPADSEVPDEVARLCRRVILQPRLKGRPRTLSRRLGGVLREWQGWPLDDPPIPPEALEPATREVLAEPRDVLWVHRLSSALALGVAGGSDTILDLDDIEHRKIARAAALYRPLRRVRERLSARAWARAEDRALQRFGRVLVCSEGDREYLGADHVRVVPNGAALDEDTAYCEGAAGRMVFVGTMDYRPNDDAMCWFLADILPAIRQRLPEAHIQVIGGRPGAEVRGAHQPPTVEVLGRVEEVRPHVQQAALAVVPLRVGGGTRLKILEALALKTAVVSTTIGAEGLELRDGADLTLADDAPSFAAACVDLLRDPAARRTLAERGHATVRERYAWTAVARRVHAVVEDLLASSCSA